GAVHRVHQVLRRAHAANRVQPHRRRAARARKISRAHGGHHQGGARVSGPSHKYGGIRPPMHPPSTPTRWETRVGGPGAGCVAPAPKISPALALCGNFLQRDSMAKFLEPPDEVMHDFVGRQAMEMVRSEVAILDPVAENEIDGAEDTVRDGHCGALLATPTGNALELGGQVTVL